MKNGDMPAIPFEEVRSRIHGSPDKWINHKGLTKRETMAMHIMAARVSIPGTPDDEFDAKRSVAAADALLAALERAGQ